MILVGSRNGSTHTFATIFRSQYIFFSIQSNIVLCGFIFIKRVQNINILVNVKYYIQALCVLFPVFNHMQSHFLLFSVKNCNHIFYCFFTLYYFDCTSFGLSFLFIFVLLSVCFQIYFQTCIFFRMPNILKKLYTQTYQNSLTVEKLFLLFIARDEYSIFIHIFFFF